MRECRKHGWHERWYHHPQGRGWRCLDCHKEKDATRRAANREELNKRRREANSGRREAINLRAREDRKTRSDLLRARQRARYAADPGPVKRRTRARNRSYLPIHTDAQWEALCTLLDQKCAYCGQTGSLNRDHILPISKGGGDHILNIQPLCRVCNRRKSTNDTDYRPAWLIEKLKELYRD